MQILSDIFIIKVDIEGRNQLPTFNLGHYEERTQLYF